MSIINDALKKTQQDRKQETTQVRKFSIPIALPRQLNWGKAVLITVAAILTLTGLLIFMIPSHHWDSYTSLRSMNRTASAAQTANKMKIMLNGAFVSDKAKVAYLNNQAFQVGDTINGMKIVAISLDAIRLQHPDGMIELKTGETYSL